MDASGDVEMVEYDEFGLFRENIDEYDLEVTEIPPVERVAVELPHDPGRTVSALRWGSATPEIVFVHGGAQNAHTWDTVALALGRPALAVDLPGHGHSDWRDDGKYDPRSLADDIGPVIARLAPEARVLVGMSLGGLTSLEVAAHHPELVRQLVLVDITPGVNAVKAKAVIDFVDGPQSFPGFDDLLARTIEHNPTRSESSLRRGILHNARQLADGSWQWRYDRSSHARTRPASTDTTSTPASGAGSDPADGHGDPADGDRVSDAPDAPGASEPVGQASVDATMSPLWDDFGRIDCPITLVRGSVSPVVDDEDVAEALRRQPGLVVHVVDGAGHSVQGDRPTELAGILSSLL